MIHSTTSIVAFCAAIFVLCPIAVIASFLRLRNPSSKRILAAALTGIAGGSFCIFLGLWTSGPNGFSSTITEGMSSTYKDLLNFSRKDLEKVTGGEDFTVDGVAGVTILIPRDAPSNGPGENAYQHEKGTAYLLRHADSTWRNEEFSTVVCAEPVPVLDHKSFTRVADMDKAFNRAVKGFVSGGGLRSCQRPLRVAD